MRRAVQSSAACASRAPASSSSRWPSRRSAPAPAYVALLLIAYERFESPWAISLVLLADLLPAMLLGPVFGAAADRWSRKRCVVVADVVRAVAFIGIALVDGFAATVAFAAARRGRAPACSRPPRWRACRAWSSTAPAAGGHVPVRRDRRPRLHARARASPPPCPVRWRARRPSLLVNGADLRRLCGLLLATVRFGAAPAGAGERSARSLFARRATGCGVAAGCRASASVIAGSAAALFFGGLFNVGELLFARGARRRRRRATPCSSRSFGLGFVVGSLAGVAVAATPTLLKRRYLAGLVLIGARASSPPGWRPGSRSRSSAFALAGFGNGLMLVHERLLDPGGRARRLLGRVFGVNDALDAWAFGARVRRGRRLLMTLDRLPGARSWCAGVGGLASVCGCGQPVALRGVCAASRGPPTAVRAGSGRRALSAGLGRVLADEHRARTSSAGGRRPATPVAR